MLLNTIEDVRKEVRDWKKSGLKVGLVPTMGALHEGHIQLVKRCVDENDICVTSIFVNPTQFNDPKDLTTYPRTPEEDSKMLKEAGYSSELWEDIQSTEEYLKDEKSVLEELKFITFIIEETEKGFNEFERVLINVD